MVNYSLPQAAMETLVERMCTLQIHGGPDDGGIYSAPSSALVLGNRRLALLDLTAGGHQPMEYEGRYWITYNGELYNFPELKEELSRLGHRFSNYTDTEVILAAYSRWGVQCFAKLQGMFAFALYDASAGELLLVRDAAGIKPLYYSKEARGIAFASEIKAFAPLYWLQEANANWPVLMLAYGHLPEPETTLKAVVSLPKGCFLKYNLVTETLNLQSYKHFSYNVKISEAAEGLQAIRHQLTKAVKRHLLADAPIGVFLSGGIDSSIISIIANAHLPGQMNSLSLYFEEQNFSEKKYQDMLVRQLGCGNYQHLLKKNEFEANFPAILKAMDMPSCDGINTWFISKYAREQGFKAVLAGIGGDELFGGYPSFTRMEMTSVLQRIPTLSIRLTKYSRLKQFSRLSYLRMEGIKGAYLFLRGHFAPADIARQLDAKEQTIWNILNNTPMYPNISNLPVKEQASWMEMNMYMQNQLLRDADSMSMAHGVEIRVPFLDDEMITMALSLHPTLKYSGHLPKPLLVEAFRPSIPEPIWNRPKQGFSFPFAAWLANNPYVAELLREAQPNTQLNYTKFLDRKLHWSQLMSLIILTNRGYA